MEETFLSRVEGTENTENHIMLYCRKGQTPLHFTEYLFISIFYKLTLK